LDGRVTQEAVAATTVAAEPVSGGTLSQSRNQWRLSGSWPGGTACIRIEGQRPHTSANQRAREREPRVLLSTRASAQRRFGRLERHEPTPCRATRPSHRWSSRPASNLEPPPQAGELLAVRGDTRLRHRRQAARRRLQRARRRSTAPVRNRTPQPHGDDHGGHDTPRRHRDQKQDDEQVQRVLPRASTVEWSAQCRPVSLGPIETLPDVTGNARFTFWITAASQSAVTPWGTAVSRVRGLRSTPEPISVH
jgi:hypothetical protein